jgi:hypothetical protein
MPFTAIGESRLQERQPCSISQPDCSLLNNRSGLGLLGLAVYTTALLTVGYQSIKAAIQDPTKPLRHE